jgi:hypothetical protein
LILAGNAQETANGTPLYALYRRQRLLAGTNTATLQAPGSPGQPGSWPYYYNVSFPQPTNGPVQVNTPQTITVPTNRVGMDPNPNPPTGPAGTGPPPTTTTTAPPLPASDVWRLQDLLGGTASPQSGDDLLLSDVISFDIKVLQVGGGYGNQAFDGKLVPVPVDLPPALQNQNAAFKATGVSVFDTWTTQGPYGDATNGWNGTNTNSPYRLPLKMRVLALQITIRVWDEKTQRSRQVTIVQDM